MVETDADLAAMFDADEFAEWAVYLGPEVGAEGASCLVIVDRGQGRRMVNAGENEAVTSERRLWAQKPELASLARGGTFTMHDGDPGDGGAPTGEVFRIAGLPVLDHVAHLWSADLVIV